MFYQQQLVKIANNFSFDTSDRNFELLCILNEAFELGVQYCQEEITEKEDEASDN